MTPTLPEIDAELALLPGPARSAYADVGLHVSSDVTTKVARRILDAHEQHGAVVGPRGFPAPLARRLQWAYDAIQVADAHRESQRLQKKTGTVGLEKKMKTGKTERLAMRALVGPVPGLLRRLPEPDEATAVHLETVLAHTASAGGNPRLLAEQLDQLITELGRPVIKNLVGVVDADAALATARVAAAALRGLVPRRQGTPIDTERLDVLDGIIIELVRQARAAARVAATLTGNQAIAQAYAIDDLLG